MIPWLKLFVIDFWIHEWNTRTLLRIESRSQILKRLNFWNTLACAKIICLCKKGGERFTPTHGRFLQLENRCQNHESVPWTCRSGTTLDPSLSFFHWFFFCLLSASNTDCEKGRILSPIAPAPSLLSEHPHDDTTTGSDPHISLPVRSQLFWCFWLNTERLLFKLHKFHFRIHSHVRWKVREMMWGDERSES